MYRYAPLFIVVAASLWGVDGVILRPYLYSLPVALVVFVESSIVIVILSPFFITRLLKKEVFKNIDWVSFFLVALLGGAIGTMAITKALFYVNFVNLSIVILIQKLQPVFALVLASVLLKEKLPYSFFIWSGIAILGAYLMTFGLNIPNLSTGNMTAVAGLFALIAAISFGSSTVLSKRALQNVSFGMGTYLRFLFASIILLTVVLSTGQINNLNQITHQQLLVFLLIAFSTGGAAIFLYYYGLKNVPASVATICELAFPLTAILLEYFIRRNILDIIQWLGVGILFFAILRVTKFKLGAIN